ncbi:MAG: arginine--tRNA ligase [Rickettsiaceae bacterium]|nr:arginine--tRNA ligase [Rickettsiaceae bacterium]
MNIFKELGRDLKKVTQKIYPDDKLWDSANLEAPKDPLNGDIATNIAMKIASKKGGNPREVALKFKELLADIPYIAHIEVAGPGFINFTIKADKWHECIKAILKGDPEFWEVNVGNGEKVNIEYVSANPTGPMHIGHARGAVYGDVLANIMQKCGYDVIKEYYVNDAGSQIDTLTDSMVLRYQEAVTGKEAIIPEGYYPGEYLKNVAKDLVAEYGKELLKLPEAESRSKIKDFVIKAMLDLIKSDLASLGIKHDVFFSEQSLYDDNKITLAIDKLKENDLIYKGKLPPPKGKVDENWQAREQLLFKSSAFGDDQDRPVQKNDGSWAYLATDIAYAKDKIDRGFDILIYILGADHSGYVKRINAVTKAFSDNKVKSDVKISQLVNFVKDNKPVKMSKRSGHFMTIGDVINEVGKDIVRFIMLTRRNDMTLDFDFSKVVEQSKDNPVFYVQYAYVRTRSILANAKENATSAYDKFMIDEFDLSLLSSEEEIQLIKLLALWPKVLASAAKNFEPHKIAYYLIDVASRFHSIWNLGKENNEYRFVTNNDELTAARLALSEAIKKIIANGFEIIGITMVEKM